MKTGNILETFNAPRRRFRHGVVLDPQGRALLGRRRRRGQPVGPGRRTAARAPLLLGPDRQRVLREPVLGDRPARCVDGDQPGRRDHGAGRPAHEAPRPHAAGPRRRSRGRALVLARRPPARHRRDRRERHDLGPGERRRRGPPALRRSGVVDRLSPPTGGSSRRSGRQRAPPTRPSRSASCRRAGGCSAGPSASASASCSSAATAASCSPRAAASRARP